MRIVGKAVLMSLLHQPLLRLLAVNFLIGAAVAVLMLAGLLALNPGGLRTLMLNDHSGAAAFVLLLFGFLVTFGSAAMGSAVMALGQKAERDDRGGGKREPAPVRISTR